LDWVYPELHNTWISILDRDFKEVPAMGKVFQLPVREKVYEYEDCGGCHQVVDDQQQDYMEIVMPYDDYDKHLLLCSSCYESAKEYGVF
jgi:hypothetical protein